MNAENATTEIMDCFDRIIAIIQKAIDTKREQYMRYEYKCLVTVDSMPNFAISTYGVSLQIDLDIFANKGWEVISCVPINAEGVYSDQICWYTVMRRRKK